MELPKLILALASAKEGSEYLDCAIQETLFGMAKPVPHYTRSFDAAMRLLPAGWSIHRLTHLTDGQGRVNGWMADIYRPHDAMIPFPTDGKAATAALALCVAVLRMRMGEAGVPAVPRRSPVR